MTGSTGGNFVRMSFPISFMVPGNPDTVLIGFLSTNVYGGHIGPVWQSWLKVDDISLIGTTQNVPDPDFEQWDSTLIEKPDGWALPLGETPININSIQTVDKTTDAYWGSYAAHLHNVPQTSLNQLVASAYITTDFVGGNGSRPSFAVSKRYKTFNGYVKFVPQNNDTASFAIQLYAHGNIIGTGTMQIDTAVNSYQPFFINIGYNDSITMPDSASIKIAAFYYNSTDGSSLIVDNLGFDGFYDNNGYAEVPVIGLTGAIASLSLYPNPNNGALHVDYCSPLTEEISLTVYDLSGRVLYTEQRNSTANDKTEFNLNLPDLSSSVYLVNVRSRSVSVTSRFVVAK